MSRDIKHSDVGPMPTRADGLRSRAAVLDAARRLFSTIGPDIPIAQLAEEAGVSRASLYRSFPTRSHIAIELVAERGMELRQFVQDLPYEPESFFVMVRHVLESAIETADWVALIMDPATRAEADRLARAMNATVEPLLRLAQREGIVRADLEPGDIRMIVRMTQGARGPEGFVGPDETERARSLLIDGIRVLDAPRLPNAVERR